MDKSIAKNSASKRTVFKTVFDSPYNRWPNVETIRGKEIQSKVIAELAKYAPQFGRFSSRTFKGDGGAVSDSKSTAKKAKLERTPITVGLNETMRAVEKGWIACVLVCKNDVPHPRIFHHIPFQCHLRGCQAVPLPKGSAGELAALFGLPHACVVGVKQCEETSELVNFIDSRIEKISPDLSRYRKLIINRTEIVPNVKDIPKRKRNKSK